MRNIYVDGYNVINSWPVLREILAYSMDSARQKLIDVLQNYAIFTGYKVFIIFDAHMRKGGLGNKEIYPGIVVVYTKEGQTADSYIEKTVNNIGRKIEVCVVTSDLLEQQLAFQRGATRISSSEFYFQVIESENNIKMSTEKRYSQKRYKLEDSIKSDVLEKLEKIRRNR